MSEQMTFTGCKHLDFDDNYVARKQILGSGEVFWLRDVEPGLPAMVQFCKLRGRLNFPTACLKECNKQCSEYEAVTHNVDVPNP